MTTTRKAAKSAAESNAGAAAKSRSAQAVEQGPLNQLIADEIRRTLGSKRMSQNALARASGMVPLTVGRLLREERPLSLNAVDQLARGLGMTGIDLVASAIARAIHSVR